MKGLRSIFLLALPYVVTVLLPVISVFCLGNILINSYHERIIADKQKSIEIAFERYLQRIESIETLSYMIGQNGVMSDYNLINYSYQKHTLLDCMDVRDMLKDSLINIFMMPRMSGSLPPKQCTARLRTIMNMRISCRDIQYMSVWKGWRILNGVTDTMRLWRRELTSGRQRLLNTGCPSPLIL